MTQQDEGSLRSQASGEVVGSSSTPPAAGEADTTPRVWPAGSTAPDESVMKVIAENDVTFQRTPWGRWLALPPEGNERDYSWAEVNQLMQVVEVLANTEQPPSPSQGGGTDGR